VVGVPDRKFGEELCALIIVREGESLTADEVKAFCQGQIAHYKVPRYIKFVQDFPMTVTGKIQKYRIRQQMMRELGLEEIATA
jgi:fatty-acyl-CoA synthase